MSRLAMPWCHVGPLPRDLCAVGRHVGAECRSSQHAPVSLRSDSGSTGWHCNTLKERRDHQRGQHDHDLLQVPTQRRPLHRRRGGLACRNSRPLAPRTEAHRLRLDLGRCVRGRRGRLEGSIRSPGACECSADGGVTGSISTGSLFSRDRTGSDLGRCAPRHHEVHGMN